MKKAFLGLSLSLLALTGCSQFEAKKSDAAPGDINQALTGSWMETECQNGTRKLLDFSKDATGNDNVTVVLLVFGDDQCTSVKKKFVIVKETHPLKVTKYKTKYAAGTVQVGDDNKKYETVLKGERLYLGESVYIRVERKIVEEFLRVVDLKVSDIISDEFSVGNNVEEPIEKIELKDPKQIVIEEIETIQAGAPVEVEQVVEDVEKTEPVEKAEPVEEVAEVKETFVIQVPKLTPEEIIKFDNQQRMLKLLELMTPPSKDSLFQQ